MIRDFPNVFSYRLYKNRRGPFVIIFFNDGDDLNKQFFFQIRKIAIKYNELPIFRFNWEEFRKKYPNEINSPNKMLIIGNGKIIEVVETQNSNMIENIFIYIIKKRLEYVKQTNKKFIYGRRYTLPTFVPSSYIYKNIDPQKPYIENDGSEYIFPNSTAVYPSKKYLLYNKKRNLNRLISSLNKQMEIYLKLMNENNELITGYQKLKYEKLLHNKFKNIQNTIKTIKKYQKQITDCKISSENEILKQQQDNIFYLKPHSISNLSSLKYNKSNYNYDQNKSESDLFHNHNTDNVLSLENIKLTKLNKSFISSKSKNKFYFQNSRKASTKITDVSDLKNDNIFHKNDDRNCIEGKSNKKYVSELLFDANEKVKSSKILIRFKCLPEKNCNILNASNISLNTNEKGGFTIRKMYYKHNDINKIIISNNFASIND